MKKLNCRTEACPTCNGTGTVPQKETVDVDYLVCQHCGAIKIHKNCKNAVTLLNNHEKRCKAYRDSLTPEDIARVKKAFGDIRAMVKELKND